MTAVRLSGLRCAGLRERGVVLALLSLVFALVPAVALGATEMSISVDAWHVYDAAGDESSEFEHQVRVEGDIFAGDLAQKYESPSHFFDYDQSSNFVAPGTTLGRGDVFTAHRTGMSGLEASLDPDGLLDLYMVRGTGTPAGHQMFDEALEAFGDNVAGIRGSWSDTRGLDTNYRQFQASTDAGLSTDAAALSTFTGQTAARNGFSQVQSVVNGVGGGGNSCLPTRKLGCWKRLSTSWGRDSVVRLSWMRQMLALVMKSAPTHSCGLCLIGGEGLLILRAP